VTLRKIDRKKERKKERKKVVCWHKSQYGFNKEVLGRLYVAFGP
jgi:hypothetical protein